MFKEGDRVVLTPYGLNLDDSRQATTFSIPSFANKIGVVIAINSTDSITVNWGGYIFTHHHLSVIRKRMNAGELSNLKEDV